MQFCCQIRAPARAKKPSKERVTLISPVLLARDRLWKFYTPQLGDGNYKHGQFTREVLQEERR
jgi:hypothetical protein